MFWLWAVTGAALVVVGVLWLRDRRAALGRVRESADRLGMTEPRIDDLTQGIAQIEQAARRGIDDAGRESEELERLRAAIDSMTQGAIICDREGNVVFLNELGTAFSSARHGDALVEAAIHRRLDAARLGQVGDEEVDLFGPPKRTLVVHGLPLVVDGELLGGIAVVDDVSEHLRIDAIRRDFVANVSHELKTPVGALSLLAETLGDEDDPEVIRRMAGRVNEEAHRLNVLIDDLLDLSRIEADTTGELTELDIVEVVDEAIATARPLADGRNTTIVFEAPAAPQLVRGRPSQLGSALLNLLENAVKYSPDGSVVVVAVAADGDNVSVAVRDRGIGIPATDQERIFERFYRVDRGRSRATGGTGLGLSIVRHVAHNHGGSVHVVSREGEGSTFTLIIPGCTRG
ncbi:MAG: ATP-binding protein [Acidimicrobiia bacterium]|nr:ATP-binding protein [Acidimicrobiia bacterium]